MKYFTALIEVLHWFGSTQIKNVAVCPLLLLYLP